jgi:hypothetical protein
VTALDSARINAVRYFADIPKQLPAEWCVENLRFDEAGNRGPFVTGGREYIIDIVNDFGNKFVHDEALVFGSQAGKTAILMAGAAWRSQNDPCNCMWAMSSISLAQRFTRKRWIPMLRASKGTRESLPTGAQRHDVKTLEQRVGSSAFSFVGSNSPGGLSSEPCQMVILDEVDKFDKGTTEADAVNLADQRTKGQANPQRWKSSTPTIVEELIWQEAMKGDFRRYNVTCPLCGNHHPSSRRFVLAWSEAYTVLPKANVAYVVWDKEAKRQDGSWDMDRVFRSARFQCPHCAGHILDGHKTTMNRNGIWIPTKTASSGFVSRHLPSLYACAPETSTGNLAMKFLNAKNSLLGLQGFINGDLAEPYQSQDRQRERIELVSKVQIEMGSEWSLQLVADCQFKSPHFWYVVRGFNGKASEGIEAGNCDTIEQLREIQLKHKIIDAAVMLDSGHGAKSDASIYKNCARFGEIRHRNSMLPLHLGWMPAKGMPENKRWKNEDGLQVPFFLQSIDPYVGTSDAGQIEMSLFEFSSDYIKDVLEDLRKGEAGHKWSVSPQMDNEDYWRHLDAKIKVAEFNKRTGRTVMKWQKRSQHWPDHLDDCEIMQIGLAAFFGIIDLIGK